MKIYALFAATLALTACGVLGLPATTSAPDTVFALRAGYDAAFLKPAAAYNSLHRCPLPMPCSDQGVVDQLRLADASAKALLDGAENVARHHPELDAKTAISAAHNAVTAATQILTLYGVK